MRVDKDADKPGRYPRPDVNLTVDSVIKEARKLKERDKSLVIDLKGSYPWEWWQCEYENQLEYKTRYYEMRSMHSQICKCCENARWRPGFKVVNSLCQDCNKECLQVNLMFGQCQKLRELQQKRKSYMKSLPRKIALISTEDVVRMKLELAVLR